MVKCNSRKGLTLAELLLTTMVIGIIMIGMVSVDYALRSNDQQQTRTSLATMRTAAVTEEISSVVRQAFGDPATRCVQMDNLTANDTNFICVYRDYGTPSVFTDDDWTCYTRRTNNIHKCTRTVPDGKGACGSIDPIIGMVTIDTFNAPDTPLVVSTNPDMYVEFTIKSRFDPTRPVPNAGAAAPSSAEYSDVIAQEFMTNPKVKQKVRLAPAGCGGA